MKKYRLYGLIICGVVLVSCVKQEFKVKEYDDRIHPISSVMPSIVGKWKMIQWTSEHSSLTNCDYLGGGSYNAEDYNVDIVIEVKANGQLFYYKQDALISKWVISKQINDLDSYYVNLNGGSYNVGFHRFNESQDISECVVGDSIKIYNPFTDLTVQSGSVISYNGVSQTYVKIE